MASGSSLYRPGDPCKQFVYVLNGSIRVSLLSDVGNEVLLYRLGAGDTCVLTTSCLLGKNSYSASAVVENDLDLLTMSDSEFVSAMNSSEEFRKLVFNSFSERLSGMMEKLDEVAFHSIGCRLANALLARESREGRIEITHDLLAIEIGSAREVVSRKIAQWQQQGLVDRGRGYIQILDSDQIQNIANSTG